MLNKWITIAVALGYEFCINKTENIQNTNSKFILRLDKTYKQFYLHLVGPVSSISVRASVSHRETREGKVE